MPIDYKAELFVAVWTAVTTNSTIADEVKPGRRIDPRTDGEARLRYHGAAADYCQFRLEVKGGSTAQNAKMTFAMNKVGFTAATGGNPPVPATQDLLMTFTYDKVKLSQQTPIEAAAKASLMAIYPKLGLGYVVRFAMAERRFDGKDVNGTTRGVCEILVRVAMRLRLSQLIPS